MNVSLTPELKRLVEKRVASGRYSSASEVVREALRLLERHDKAFQVRLKQLRSEIDAGLADLEAGRRLELAPNALDRIKKEGRKELVRQSKKRA